jgi:ABC-type antimicrobial peptide transport system permease subunit
VQLQNVLERRGELALLRATGFGRWRLIGLVMIENVLLLLCGLGIGVLAALVAILPHWLLGGASIPWDSLLVILAAVVATGMAAGLLAARSVLRAPILEALRSGAQ